MARYLTRRAMGAIVVIFVASVVVFLGVRALPGTPESALGPDTDPAAFSAIRHEYGLDKPIFTQYVIWVERLLRGNLGRDDRDIPVGHEIVTALPVTLELALLSLLLSLVVGIGGGVVAAWWRGGVADYAATLVAVVGLSVPGFWIGLMMIVVFAADLHWLPAIGFVSLGSSVWQNLAHMVMPVLVLGFAMSAVIMRQARSAMLDALSSDYVRTARAKGLPTRHVAYHALRNSLLTVTTLVGLELGALISGAAVTEQIFGLPGFGQLTLTAINQRDYPLLQGTVLVTAVGYVVVNFLVDVVYSLLDPRISVTGEVVT